MTDRRTHDTAAPAIPSTPVTVEDTWIDYNGHLSEGYFVLAFSRAIDDMLGYLGLGHDYRDTSNCAVFTVEAHVRYLNQVRPGATVDIRNRITAADTKRLHTAHDMYVGDTLCATEEVTGLHVDRTANKVVAFPPDLRASLAAHLDHQESPSAPTGPNS